MLSKVLRAVALALVAAVGVSIFMKAFGTLLEVAPQLAFMFLGFTIFCVILWIAYTEGMLPDWAQEFIDGDKE